MARLLGLLAPSRQGSGASAISPQIGCGRLFYESPGSPRWEPIRGSPSLWRSGDQSTLIKFCIYRANYHVNIVIINSPSGSGEMAQLLGLIQSRLERRSVVCEEASD